MSVTAAAQTESNILEMLMILADLGGYTEVELRDMFETHIDHIKAQGLLKEETA